MRHTPQHSYGTGNKRASAQLEQFGEDTVLVH